MHEYSTEKRKTDTVIFRIALLAIIITPFVNIGISMFTGLIKKYMEISYTVSSIMIFTILYFIFNKFIWKIIPAITHIPNLNGRWRCYGHSFNYQNKNEYDWESEIYIKQEWNKIGITQHTKDSDSFSTSIIGGLKVEDNGEVLLSYVYSNDPRGTSQNLMHHEGVVKLRFNKNLKSANGDYFNDQSRQTYGSMKLEKLS